MQVNAMYSPTYNTIQIPAAMMQEPFFEVGNPNAVNYGKLGMIAGHEMMHAFDVSYSFFDGYGNKINWWTTQSLLNYLNRSSCFISDYRNAGMTISEVHSTKSKIRGENISDSGGLKCDYRAFRNVKKKKKRETRLSEYPDLDSRKLFFLSYAQNWCSYDKKVMKFDVHPDGKYRTNIVLNNNPDFLDAFNCPKPKKPLCSVW